MQQWKKIIYRLYQILDVHNYDWMKSLLMKIYRLDDVQYKCIFVSYLTFNYQENAQ